MDLPNIQLAIHFNGYHKNKNFLITDVSGWKCRVTTIGHNHTWTFSGSSTWVMYETNRNRNNWNQNFDRPYYTFTPEMIAFMKRIEQFVGPFMQN